MDLQSNRFGKVEVMGKVLIQFLKQLVMSLGLRMGLELRLLVLFVLSRRLVIILFFRHHHSNFLNSSLLFIIIFLGSSPGYNLFEGLCRLRW